MTDRQILNRNLAQMLKGGVIMDVTNAQEAEIAEAAGAVAVMALERVPSDIRRDGGVARMSDPKLIKEIKSAVSIPVMAKVRIGHIVEAEILEALGANMEIGSDEIVAILKRHHVSEDMGILQDRYRRQLGQRLMASLRDDDGRREVMSNGKGRYFVVRERQ